MRTGWKLLVAAAVAYGLGFVSGTSFDTGVELQQYSVGAPLPAMVCALYDIDSLHKHLADDGTRNLVREVRTVDSDNAIIILHGTSVYEIRFPGSPPDAGPSGCQRL
jgi:hypothetical protein